MVVGSTAVVLTAGVIGAWLFNKSDTPQAQPQLTNATTTTAGNTTTSANGDSTATITPPAITSNATASGSYKDGTYTSTVSYYVPRGSNSLTAKVTVTSGTVTAVKVDHNYNDRESGMYIDSFESALQSAAVGKSIDGLSPGRIGGATLTTQAFDDALTAVRNDAKA